MTLARYVPARPRDLLARVLQQSDLVAAVRALPPRAIGALVRQIGLEELAFVVNVLSAGGRKEGRAYRPVEAVEDAVDACNVGLQTARASRLRASASDLLTTLSVDRLFRIGWRAKQSASSPA